MNDDLYNQRRALKEQLESNSIFFQNHHFEITSTYKDSSVLVNLKFFYPKKITTDLIKNLIFEKIDESKVIIDLQDSTMICEIDKFDDNETLITLSSYISLTDMFIQVNQIELMISSFLIVENKISE